MAVEARMVTSQVRYRDPAHWLFQRATAGSGILSWLACHYLDLLCYLLGAALWLFVPLALYRLLRDVNQPLAMLMVILGSLVQVPIFFMNAVTDAATLLFARGADFLSLSSA